MPLIPDPVEEVGNPFPGRPGHVVSPSGKPAWTAARWAATKGIDAKTAQRRVVAGEVPGEWLDKRTPRRTRFYVLDIGGPEPVGQAEDARSQPESHGAPGARSAEGRSDYSASAEPRDSPMTPHSAHAVATTNVVEENERLRREVRRLRTALQGAHITIDSLKDALTGLQEGHRELYTPDSLND